MDSKMTEWMLSFPCSRCAFMGIEKLGTVHVLGKDEHEELQIIAFCYDCARIMMERRKRPRPKIRNGSSSPLPSAASQRVVRLNLPKRTYGAGLEEFRGTIRDLKRLIGDIKGAVESTCGVLSAGVEVRRQALNYGSSPHAARSEIIASSNPAAGVPISPEIR